MFLVKFKIGFYVSVDKFSVATFSRLIFGMRHSETKTPTPLSVSHVFTGLGEGQGLDDRTVEFCRREDPDHNPNTRVNVKYKYRMQGNNRVTTVNKNFSCRDT